MIRTFPHCSDRIGRTERRGFTLIELLVAITAGLFVSIAALALARQGSKFFQQEARIAATQFGATLGFERLRADIARAGFMSTPNMRDDPLICDRLDATNAAGPIEMRRLAAVRLISTTAALNTAQTANGLYPDGITLSGSYSSVEWFPVASVASNANVVTVALQVRTGAVARSGGVNQLSNVFQAGRMLRILDSDGRYEYGAINSYAIDADGKPIITLSNTNPPVALKGTAGKTCGIVGFGTGMQANIVNIVHYEIQNLQGAPGAYAPLYAAAATAPGDESRLELVRYEMDSAGAMVAGTLELVAEYAVDLRFGLSAVTNAYGATGVDPIITQFAIGAAQAYAWADDITATPTTLPQRIRSVRVRMAVRSREGDRPAALDGGAGGLFRYAMPGGVSFARVRTVTADIALPNLTPVTW
jgi:prepilin-type N-terminal cleavage/methylation domain-containing protein